MNGQTLGYIDEPQIDDVGFVAFFSAPTNGKDAVFIAEPKAPQAQEKQDSDHLPNRALLPNSAIVRRLKASYQAGVERLEGGSSIPFLQQGRIDLAALDIVAGCTEHQS